MTCQPTHPPPTQLTQLTPVPPPALPHPLASSVELTRSVLANGAVEFRAQAKAFALSMVVPPARELQKET